MSQSHSDLSTVLPAARDSRDSRHPSPQHGPSFSLLPHQYEDVSYDNRPKSIRQCREQGTCSVGERGREGGREKEGKRERE